MQCGTRLVVVVGLTFLACLGSGIHASEAQVTIESVIPSQVPRGQTTVVNVAFPGRDLVVSAAEISPSAGVTISGLKKAAESQGISWWELAVAVAPDAAPGDRSLVLVMPRGRTLPAKVAIPSHSPSIGDLSVTASSSAATVDVQFSATDSSGDLGEAPYVWFTTGCGADAEQLVGAVSGTVSAGRVRATVPNPRQPGRGPSGSGPCDIRVRATDAGGIESNTLKTTIEFRN